MASQQVWTSDYNSAAGALASAEAGETWEAEAWISTNAYEDIEIRLEIWEHNGTTIVTGAFSADTQYMQSTDGYQLFKVSRTFTSGSTTHVTTRLFFEASYEGASISTPYWTVKRKAFGLRAPDFIEKPIGPSVAWSYFPLDIDAQGMAPASDTKTIAETIATNIAYEDSSAFVGTATTNLWPTLTGTLGFTGGTITQSLPGPYTLNAITTEVSNSTSHSASSGNNVGAVTNGESWTVSAFYRHIAGNLPAPSGFTMVQSTARASINKTLIKSTIPAVSDVEWKRGIGSYLYTETTTAGYPNVVHTNLGYAKIKIDGVQIEKKPFATAFTPTSRSAGILGFDLYTDCSMDWSGDWTITYMRKVAGTANNTISGYNIDSLGRSTNTVGGGYVWFGKTTGADTWGYTSSSSRTTIAFGTIQYTWYRVVVRYNSSTTTLTFQMLGEDGSILHDEDWSFTIPSANYYLTQNGYDLMLGGWDNGNPCNTYFKDLVVVVGTAMTDSEIESAFYDTMLRVDSVNGEIRSGEFSEDI